MGQPGAMSFSDMGLDPRILRALAKQGLSSPTPVQAAAVPAALEGKDIVARARTGSGKTLAYLLPALQRVVAGGSSRQPWQVLVLVPTRELCDQVAGEARAVAQHCGVPVPVTALLGDTPAAQRAAAVAAGAVVVATPARVASALRERWLQPAALAAALRVLVLDEADLLLSYGYAEDLQALAVHVPRSAQCMLMSATSSAEVEQLQQLVLHNPVTLNLLAAGGGGGGAAAGGAKDGGGGGGGAAGIGEGGAGSAAEILHYSYACGREDRRLVVLALLKLGLLRKKVLIFANSVEEGVGLRLFLESFGLRMGCLHAELPVNSRSHILASFNKGLFDFLIAVDDVHARERTAAAAAAAAAAAEASAGGRGRKRKRKQGDDAAGGKQQQQQARRRKDEEFGVTRGIDFKGVRSIVNYEAPDSVQGYVHRAGRTGRAGQGGLALTLVTAEDEEFAGQLGEALAAQREAAAAAAGGGAGGGGGGGSSSEGSSSGSDSDSDEEGGGGRGAKRRAAGAKQALRPFTRLTAASVEALRYRAEDVGRTITRAAVREARARELQRELLNSERLAEYFEEHEAERALLKHDKPMHRKAGNAPHLRHVPAYLRDPAVLSAAQKAAAGIAAVVAAERRPRPKGPKAKRQKRADPLKAAAPGAGGHAAAGQATGAAHAPSPTAAAAVAAPKQQPKPSGGVFARAPKKGGSGADEQLTELERAALAKPLKLSKERALAGIGGAAARAKVLGPKLAAMAASKRNVLKVRPTMGAGAKARR